MQRKRFASANFRSESLEICHRQPLAPAVAHFTPRTLGMRMLFPLHRFRRRRKEIQDRPLTIDAPAAGALDLSQHAARTAGGQEVLAFSFWRNYYSV